MACPSETELLGFLRERAAYPHVISHIDECESCEQLLVAFGELSSSRAPKGSDPAPDAGADVLPVEGDVLGRYEIERQLGKGAMGVVYAARDPKLDRRIALKLLLQRQRSALEEARILLEARAAARVHHAHLVSVYDVGTWNGRVFLAMEYVDGPTLTRWLSKEPRTRAEVLAVFKDIARGIVAAHTAGLVHCDIKPDNILIGPAGAKLGDFGLAVGPEHAGAAGARGTPKYMAPEVKRDEAPTPASDQYSFCVTLREALPDVPPRWLANVIERGLATDPRDRFVAMADLLAKLERGTARRRVVVATGLVTAAAATGITLLAARGPAADPCPPPVAAMTSVWNPTRLVELSTLYGADALRVGKRFDAYRDAWLSTSVTACRDTRVTHRFSADVLDHRTQCLERARARLRTTIDTFSRDVGGDAAITPDDLLRAADNLPALSDCNDVSPTVPAPVVSPALRTQEAVWQTALDVAMTMVDLRRPQVALDNLTALDAGIVPLATSPNGQLLAANRQYIAGLALTLLDRRADGIRAFEQGYEAARAAANERLEVKIALEMAGLLDREPDTRGEAKSWLGRGRAVATRLEDPILFAMVYEAEGSLAYVSNDYPAAVTAFGDAVAALGKLYSDDDLRTALARQNYALALNKTGRSDAARAEVTKAIAGLTNARGDSHPSLVTMYNTLGNVEITTGNVAAARTAFTEARRRAALTRGETDRMVIALDINLASIALREDDFEAARAGYERAIAALEKVGHRGNHAWRGARQGLAQLAIRRKDFASARVILDELIAQRLADKVPDVVIVAALRTDLAITLAGLDQHAKAEEQLLLARGAYVAKLGESHAKVAYVDVMRAEIATPIDPARATRMIAPLLARTDLPRDLQARAHWRAAKLAIRTDRTRAGTHVETGAKIAAEGGDRALADEINAWYARQAR